MGNRDAEQKFLEAVNTYRTAEQKARGGLNKIAPKAFQMVIIDLDAAIPGLTGVMLGLALLFKAGCLHWLHLDELFHLDERSIDLRLLDVDAPPDPHLKEGLSCALRGREILKKLGSTVHLPWANDLVKKLGGN